MKNLSYFLISFLFLLSFKVYSKEATKIVFLGDSLTEGYKIAKEKSFPLLVEKLLNQSSNKKFTVVNAGRSGATTAGSKKRLKWQLKGNPKVVVIALGANDALRGLEVQYSKKNLDALIEMAKKNQATVFLLGMKAPPNYGSKYTNQFEQMYNDLAKQHKISLMPFLLKDVAAVKSLNLSDGIHPNAKGYEIIAKNVYDFLKPHLENL